MQKTDLEQITSNIDSAKLAAKPRKDPFIGEVVIGTAENIIPIPKGATIMRAKSGEARFFSRRPGPGDDYITLPKGAKELYFQDYEPAMCNIHYGDPTFNY